MGGRLYNILSITACLYKYRFTVVGKVNKLITFFSTNLAKVKVSNLIPGHKVGFKVPTLFELCKTLIHEKTDRWRLTKEGVPSLILRSKDVDEGDQIIIISEPKLSSQDKVG